MASACSQGITIHYELEGAGPPIVLVHQLMQNLEAWRRMDYTDELAKDHWLIPIDSRGHGRNDKPHEKDAYAPERRASDVPGAVHHLGIGEYQHLRLSLGGSSATCCSRPFRIFQLADRWRHRLDASATEAERGTAGRGEAMLVKTTVAGGGAVALRLMDACVP